MNQNGNDRWAADWDIPSHPRAGRDIIGQIIENLSRLGWSDREQFAVDLALEEAVANAMCHGNANDPSKRVRIGCELTPQRLVVRIQDEGPGFDPEGIPDCTCDHNLDKPSGRGIFLMQRYMDRICYDPCEGRLVMEKLREIQID
jgi:serine/threonine-protein kinase RsbW